MFVRAISTALALVLLESAALAALSLLDYVVESPWFGWRSGVVGVSVPASILRDCAIVATYRLFLGFVPADAVLWFLAQQRWLSGSLWVGAVLHAALFALFICVLPADFSQDLCRPRLPLHYGAFIHLAILCSLLAPFLFAWLTRGRLATPK